MDKNKIARIRAVVKEALEKAFKGENLTITQGNARYNSTEVTFKLKFNEGKVLKPEDKASEDFRKHCHHFGLEETDLGRIALLRKSRTKIMEVTVIGLLPNRRTDNVILVKTIDNKNYCVSVKGIKEGFALMKTKPVKQPISNRSEERILDELRSVHIDLENDMIDMPLAFIEKRKRELHGKLDILYKELGRIPAQEEIWNVG